MNVDDLGTEGRVPAPDLTTERRHVVLLQGPSSFFFKHLGHALRRCGARVTRIGFAPGDRVYWSNSAGSFVRCAVRKDAFGDWMRGFLEREQPSDLVLLGDGRFYHRIAVEMARAQRNGPRVHVVEHGLIRPGWILVEPDGLGGASRIPERFEDWEADGAVPESKVHSAGFLTYALLDVGYHVAGMAFGWAYNPHYVRHTPVSPYREYIGWIGKFMKRRRTRKLDRLSWDRIEGLSESNAVFLLPLQLAADYQILDHGHGLSLLQHVERMLASFAMHAPKEAVLVVKRHPLDNGLTNWRGRVHEEAARLGVAERVLYFDGCDLDEVMQRAAGVVTVNSTVGMQAVLSGVPCCVTGTAVYDLPGLTSPGSLDEFWQDTIPPERSVAERFRKFLLAEYHVPGSFDGPGARVGAVALAERILA